MGMAKIRGIQFTEIFHWLSYIVVKMMMGIKLYVTSLVIFVDPKNIVVRFLKVKLTKYMLYSYHVLRDANFRKKPYE